MKALILFLISIFSIINSFAQDTLFTNSGSFLPVKIVKIENGTIYFYQTIDKLKQIRAVSINTVKDYKFISTNNGKNIEVLKSDSILYLNYLRKSKGLEPVLVGENSEVNYDTTLMKTKPNNANNTSYSLTVNSYYETAGNSIVVSGVFLILGSALQVINYNREIDLTTASSDDIDNFNKNSKYLANVSYGLFAVSGIFMLNAGVNINNGSVKLK